MSVTHIAGPNITVNDRFTRQRCAWCAQILSEYDLDLVAVPVGQEGPPGSWETGALVTVDGNASWVIEADRLPDDSCARAETETRALAHARAGR